MKTPSVPHPLDVPFRHAFAFKGGSAPKPPPPPAPPPTATKVEVTQAKRDARMQNQQRAGITSTILAGETGGYSDQQKKTLLG